MTNFTYGTPLGDNAATYGIRLHVKPDSSKHLYTSPETFFHATIMQEGQST